MPPAPRPSAAKISLVQAFRGETRAPLPLHPLERALVIVASIHLCFLAWAIAGRDPWAQFTGLGLGLVAFIIALLPRRYSGELAPEGDFTLHPFPRLLRFPVFWIGLLVFAYIVCQALNPAWIRGAAGRYTFIAPIPHIEWLPSGIKAPFAEMNAWRFLVIWGGAWLLACALWTAITRRVAAQAILTVLVANGVVLALVGILQKLTGAKLILWFYKAPASYFVSTFAYKNHGGAYFNLILVVAAGFMAWHYLRSLRRLERSSPAPVYAFALFVLGAMVYMSGSRTAMLLLAGFFLVGGGIFLAWRLRSGGSTTHPAVAGFLALGGIILVGVAIPFLKLDQSIGQIKRLANEDRGSIDTRVLGRQATMDLFRLEPATGWGAGSFRHAFPLVQKNYEEIRVYRGNRTYLGWSNAHNDYVELLAEFGLAGALLVLLIPAWMIWRFCRLGALVQPAFLILLAGLGLPLAHAWVDFIFANCAIIATYCAVWVLAVRWLELENTR